MSLDLPDNLFTVPGPNDGAAFDPNAGEYMPTNPTRLKGEIQNIYRLPEEIIENTFNGKEKAFIDQFFTAINELAAMKIIDCKKCPERFTLDNPMLTAILITGKREELNLDDMSITNLLSQYSNGLDASGLRQYIRDLSEYILSILIFLAKDIEKAQNELNKANKASDSNAKLKKSMDDELKNRLVSDINRLSMRLDLLKAIESILRLALVNIGRAKEQ